MKKLLILSMFIGGLMGAVINNALAGDTDWTKSEHNYTVNYRDYGVNIRQYMRDDYAHVELMNNTKIKLPKIKEQKIQLALRIAEDNNVREYRPKLTHKVGKFEFHNIDIALAHRIEYRHYESDSQADYIRYRSIAKYSMDLTPTTSVYAKAQPRWVFQKAGESNDLKVDDVKTNIGINFNLDPLVVFSPYVEIMLKGHDDSYANKSMMLGTALSIKF